jgi:hypothetical protein
MSRSTTSGVDVILVSAADDTVKEYKLRIWNGDENGRVEWRRPLPKVNVGGEEDYLSSWGFYVDFENEPGFNFAGMVLKRRDVEESPVARVRDDGRPVLRRWFTGGSVYGVRRRRRRRRRSSVSNWLSDV